jgi:hypothetical protein
MISPHRRLTLCGRPCSHGETDLLTHLIEHARAFSLIRRGEL